MQPIVLLGALALPAAVVATLIVLGLRAGRHDALLGPDTTIDEATRRIRDHLRRARAIGLAVAIVLATAWTLAFRSATALPVDARLVFVAAPAVPIIVLVAVILGEATVPLTRTAVRVASLSPRTVGQYLGRARRIVLWTVVGAAAAVLITGSATAAPDGRSFAYECALPDGTTMLGSNSPYPGAVYAVPGLVVLTGAGLATVLATRRVLARPPVVLTGDPAGHIDHGLRQHALRSATRAATASAALLMTQTGVAMYATLEAVNSTMDLNGPCQGSPLLTFAEPGAAVVALVGAVVLVGLLVDVMVGAMVDRETVRQRSRAVSHA